MRLTCLYATASFAALLVAFIGGVPSVQTLHAQPLAAGLGEYRFGMTRDQVQHVGGCGPYRVVAGTNGLECPNFRAGSRTINVSFIFAGEALDRIQLWFYDGASESAARDATAAMLTYMSDRGPLRSREIPAGTPLTASALLTALRARGQTSEGARVQILTKPTASAPFVHGSVTRFAGGFYVFLFFSATNGDVPKN